MAEGFLAQGIELIIAFAKGVFMTLFVNWWRKQTIAHINTTVTHEKIKMKAKFDGRIPHLVLSWVIVNRSNVNLKINRIAGELYIGAWRVAYFDSDRILEAHYGCTWNPLIATQKLKLYKRGDKTEVVITIFPSLEFWFMNTQPYGCSLYNSNVDVSFAGGYTTTKLPNENNIVIEDCESVLSKYSDSLKNVMKSKFGETK